MAIFQNITEQKQIGKDLENAKIAARNVLEDLQAEKEKLAETHAKDEAILANIGDGLVVTDLNQRIVFINLSGEKILGWETGELIGKYLFNVVKPKDDKSQEISLDKFFPQKKLTAAINCSFIKKDSSILSVSVTTSKVSVEGKFIGFIVVFRDVTKEKEVDRAKTEFVSLASHQLRTPLSTVNWYSEMLLAGDAGKLNMKQKKYLDEVYHGNQRMVALVDALLNVSRLELGTFLIEPEPTNMVKLAQSVIDEQKLQVDKKKITLSTAFKTNIPLIQADPKLLRMIMQNLLSNAVKYTPEKGKIEFSLAMDNEGKSVFLKISDTGYGIPKDQQDKIFIKLFRADNAREKDANGTGLGLYIVKAIVEQSGGLIWFDSEENKGTTFYVTLPLTGIKRKEDIKTFI